ncbi:MAG TPA: class I poly(R)-hydroxyalkanoic acid synthase [Burkholderiales bacterium]|nr:class I poly(R)-hydroxyalkanoic acid synthase [Burkholderiales bacterium]
MESTTGLRFEPMDMLARSEQKLIESLVRDLPLRGLDLAALLTAFLANEDTRGRLAALQSRFYREWLRLWTNPAQVPRTAAADRRFQSPEWDQLPWFRFLLAQYELFSDYLIGLAELPTLEPRLQRRLRFVIRHLVDALAPTNYPASNPEVVKAAIGSRGETLARGLQRLKADLARGRISMTDESAFEVGRNLAVTPGEVIFENEVMQLIQYRPATPEVFERPLLVIPPFINKYYVLDLQPDNSFARFCVERGFTTCMVSWRNIPPQLGHLSWDDYIAKGVLEPLDVVRDVGAGKPVSTLGFCVGGTLLACALAVLAAHRRSGVCSLTLLASMLDFSDTGEISVYVDRDYVQWCEREYGSGGVIPGTRLAAAFATLRANDLIWYFVVNNYLLGRDPKPFDLLYWNADGSNLPGPLYAYYLRNMYLENNLRVGGRLRMQGVPVDLSRITLPALVFAARDDHIVPWRTAYESARLLGGRTEFVLGGSGHVGGVVNPPSRNQRQHWINAELPADPDDWLAAAQMHGGSWWNHWSQWLAKRSGARRPAPASPGSSRFRPIEAAPGRYVREHC